MAFTYTGENVQETPQYKIPPEGDYTVVVLKGEEKISKSGKDMIQLTLKIQHPEYRNELFDYIVDGEYAQQRIFNIANSCGIALQKGMPVNAQTFVNRRANVRIKHEDYNGEKQIKVKSWLRPTVTSAPAPSTVVDPAFGPPVRVNPDEIPF